MAGGDEAPMKTQKRTEGHSHILGDGQRNDPSTAWETSIGRRDGDQAKDRFVAERLRGQHTRTGRHLDKLGAKSPAAVWACQGAARPDGKEAQSRGGALSCNTAEGPMGAWASRSEHHDAGGATG